MKRFFIALALVCGLYAPAHATPTTFTDKLSPSPQGTGFIVQRSSYTITFDSSINGTQFNGQNAQLNLLFNGFFLRAFTETQRISDLNPLFVDLTLPYLPFWTTPQPPPDAPTISGTATLLDAQGQPIGSATALAQGLDGGPSFQPDIRVFLLRPDFGIPPVDIYGIRYNLNLSDSPGHMLAVAPRSDQIEFSGFFGVGPGRIPADTVPDTGGTLGLLLCGIAALAIHLACRRSVIR